MDWSIIIVAIPLIIAAFFLGRLFASKPIEDNNNKIRQQLNELLQIIDIKKAEQQKLEIEIQNKQEKNKWIENQYQERLKVIENTKQLADEAALERRKVLDIEFEKQKNLYEQQKSDFQNEIQSLKQDLDSIKETRRAAIASRSKELTVEQNKDEYTLILPREEERDIPILREVQYKISKPRAIGMCIWSNYYLPIAKEKLPKILGGNEVCGIYKLTNQKTGECYIGQARDIKKRIYEHMRAACGVDTPAGNQLYIAMQKYGIENFTIELLIQCSPNELNEKEKYFIELYQSQVYGYNIISGNKTRAKIDK